MSYIDGIYTFPFTSTNFQSLVNDSRYPYFNPNIPDGKGFKSQLIIPSSSTKYFNDDGEVDEDSQPQYYTKTNVTYSAITGKYGENCFNFVYVPFNAKNNTDGDYKSSSTLGIKNGFDMKEMKCACDDSGTSGDKNPDDDRNKVYRLGGSFARVGIYRNSEKRTNATYQHTYSSNLGGKFTEFDLNDIKNPDSQLKNTKNMNMKISTGDDYQEIQHGCYINTSTFLYGNIPRLRNEELVYSTITGSTDKYNNYSVVYDNEWYIGDDKIICEFKSKTPISNDTSFAYNEKYRYQIEAIPKSRILKDCFDKCKEKPSFIFDDYDGAVKNNVFEFIFNNLTENPSLFPDLTDTQRDKYLYTFEHIDSTGKTKTCITPSMKFSYTNIPILEMNNLETKNISMSESIENLEIFNNQFPDFYGNIADNLSNSKFINYLKMFIESNWLDQSSNFISDKWKNILKDVGFGNNESKNILLNFGNISPNDFNNYKSFLIFKFNEVCQYLLIRDINKAKQAFKELLTSSSGNFYKESIQTLFIPCVIDYFYKNISSIDALGKINGYGKNIEFYLTDESGAYSGKEFSFSSSTDFYFNSTKQECENICENIIPRNDNKYSIANLDTVSKTHLSDRYKNLDEHIHKFDSFPSINNTTFAVSQTCSDTTNFVLELPITYKIYLNNETSGISLKTAWYLNGKVKEQIVNCCCCNPLPYIDKEGKDVKTIKMLDDGKTKTLKKGTNASGADVYQEMQLHDVSKYGYGWRTAGRLFNSTCSYGKNRIRNGAMIRCIYDYIEFDWKTFFNTNVNHEIGSIIKDLTSIFSPNQRYPTISINLITNSLKFTNPITESKEKDGSLSSEHAKDFDALTQVTQADKCNLFFINEAFTNPSLPINVVYQQNIFDSTYCFSDEGEGDSNGSSCIGGVGGRKRNILGTKMYLPQDLLIDTGKTVAEILTSTASNNLFIASTSKSNEYMNILNEETYSIDIKGSVRFNIEISSKNDCPMILNKDIYVFSQNVYDEWKRILTNDNFINYILTDISQALNQSPKCFVLANLHEKFGEFVKTLENSVNFYNNPLGPACLQASDSFTYGYQFFMGDYKLMEIDGNSQTIYDEFTDNSLNYLDILSNSLFTSNAVATENGEAICVRLPFDNQQLMTIPKINYSSTQPLVEILSNHDASEELASTKCLVFSTNLGINDLGVDFDSELKSTIPKLSIEKDNHKFTFNLTNETMKIYRSKGIELSYSNNQLSIQYRQDSTETEEFVKPIHFKFDM